MIKITKDIQIIDLALYIQKQNTLIITDTHIGYEEALNKQGIFIPRFQFGEIIKRLNRIFDEIMRIKCKESLKNNKLLSEIIINGDVKHEFGDISEQEWRYTLKLLDFLGKCCKRVILIRGNHDTILGPIAKKRNIIILKYYITGEILIMHGDEITKSLINNKYIKTIIIGHEHPAISLRYGLKSELYKCYLKGRYAKKSLIVQPSFNLVTEGTDISREELLSPFLQQDLSDFEVYIVQDKVYEFGKLKNLKKED